MDLANEFLAESGGSASDPAALQATLAKLHAQGSAAWPLFRVNELVFARHLGALSATNSAMPLEQLRGDDLYLACACSAAEPRALSELDRLLGTACGALPGGSRALSDEVRQLLREKLLIARGDDAPQIAGYSGLGPLATWLRVIAVRAALGLRKKDAREISLEDVSLEQADNSPDPEIDYLKLRHGEEFRAAFRDAAQLLSPRDRNLLRHYYVDGLGVEKLGLMHQVHASTVSRWLSQARDTLLLETKRLLGERLKLTGREVESLLGVLRSQLQTSLRRILV